MENYYTNGCHWGGPVRLTPSFFNLCYREQIVIVPGIEKNRDYNIGDRILLISGMTVDGVAEITAAPFPSSDCPEFEEEFFMYVTTTEGKTTCKITRNTFYIYQAIVKKANLKHGDIRYNYNRAYYSIKNKQTIAMIDRLLQSD